MKEVKIVGVSSGKGGVGKSTISANLAVALASIGVKVGLIDADFYGPSIPILLGGGEISVNSEGIIIPCFRYGVKYVSIQFFLPNLDDPIIWRGPMLTKALSQMIFGTDWSGIDIILIDMPPGTGDIQISLSQLAQLSGVILISTPQKLAVSDVLKAGNMFKKVNIPILGVIENMADGQVKLFGEGTGQELADRLQTKLLAKIALIPEIVHSSDQGYPFALTQDGAFFMQIANDLIHLLASQNLSQVKVG